MRRLLLAALLFSLPAFALNTVVPAFQLTSDGTHQAAVINTTPAGSEYGVIVRIAGAAAGGTSSSFGAAIPAAGTAAGFSDGTNMQLARVFDADSGAGSQYVLGTNLRISASGGSIEAVGQQTMAVSIPVVIASNQSTLPVSQGAPTGIATFVSAASNIAANNGTATLTGTGTLTAAQPFEAFRVRITAPVSYWQCKIQYMNNVTPTVLGYVTNQNSEVKPTKGAWRVTSVGGSGTQALQAVCNNLDTLNAQDFIVESDYCQGAGC